MARTPASPRSLVRPPSSRPARSPTLAKSYSPTLSRSYPRGTRLGFHMHREAQLLFSAQGMMQVTTPKGLWLVPPARAVWLPARMEHAVEALSDIEMRALLVPVDFLAAHVEAPRLGREFIVSVRPLLRQIILGLFEKSAHRQRVELLLGLALFELAEAEDAATFVPMPNDPRARRVAELVLAHPDGQQDLDSLAEQAGASARTVTRLFAAETDLTFKEWRQRARIAAAIELLGEGRGIKQVAGRLGFSSVAAFGYAFRQIMGTTPGDMQRRMLSADW